MVLLALAVWLLSCFAVFYLALTAAGEALPRLEDRTLAATEVRLDALWLKRPSPRKLLQGSAAAALVAGLLAGLALHPAAGVLASLSILAVPALTLRALQARRRAAFEAQLTDVLDALAGSLRSGFSLEQGLGLAAAQAPPPMRQELGLVLREAGLGTPLEQALEGLALRMPGEDLSLFVPAVAMARETGASLADVLSELALTIRRRRELKGRLRSLTAQGRMQGVVLGILPVALGGVLYLLQPDMMRRFLSSSTGWVILAIGFALEILGLLWIRRILRLEV